jgi:anti-sigma B factor antagonist
MELAVEKIEGENVAIVQVAAPTMDASNAAQFKSSLAPLCVDGSKIILDLSAVKFVDSSGLGAMLSCLRKLNAIGGDLKLCGMNKPIRALFELVRMHRVFEIFNSHEEALRSLGVNAPGSADGAAQK